MRRSKISFWLLSLAFTLVSMKATALPILPDADGSEASNYLLASERACGVRNFCPDVHYTPDVPHFETFERPTLEKPLFVPPLLNQPIAFVDDIVLIDGGPGGLTTTTSTAKPVSVPEPGTLVLLAAGLFGFALRRLGSS